MQCKHCLFARLIFAHTSLADDGKALHRRHMSPESHRKKIFPSSIFSLLSLQRLMDSFKRYKDILRKILKLKCRKVCLQSGNLFFLSFFSSQLKFKIRMSHSSRHFFFLNPGQNGVIAIHSEIYSHAQAPQFKMYMYRYIGRYLYSYVCVYVCQIYSHFLIHTLPWQAMQYNEKLSTGFGICRGSICDR